MIKLLTFFWQVGILPGGLLEAMQSIETLLVQDAETQLAPLTALTWRYGVVAHFAMIWNSPEGSGTTASIAPHCGENLIVGCLKERVTIFEAQLTMRPGKPTLAVQSGLTDALIHSTAVETGLHTGCMLYSLFFSLCVVLGSWPCYSC